MVTQTIEQPAQYPAHLEADVVLRSGRTLRIRPIKPEDIGNLRTFYSELSPESLHSRFFDVCTPDVAVAASPTVVDYDHTFGVVGEWSGEIVAVAHYFSSKRHPESAEVAFAIADRAQGCGIGSLLLERLAVVARTRGIERFEAETLSSNTRMLDVFLGSGFSISHKSERGVVTLSFPIASTPTFRTAAAGRAQKAAYASMKPIFEPRSIAVIGASRRAGALGTEIVHNLRTTGFSGELYAINPSGAEIDGIKSVPSLAAVEGPVDLAIIAVPAAHVETVVDDCIAKHVGAIVVITAGFGETGAEGAAHERRLLEKVRAAGIRMVGPNCMGVINTNPGVNLHATFSRVFPPAGNVAMSSQSGALGLAVLDYARSLNIGLSTFISVGNKVDVSGNDLIQYWAEDPNTDVILLYLESFGNPRKFTEIARRVAKQKPIVCVKAGRSAAGAKAAASHTGALATSDGIVADLFRQAGIIRTDTLEELFDVASLLAQQPLPRGKRVAVMTNAGGPGILAADTCEANGLELVTLSDDTLKQLRDFLPAAASVGNPVDMIASASAEQYAKTMRLLLADPNVDAVVVIYIPVLPDHAADVANAIREGAAGANDKTVVATFMGANITAPPLGKVPSFPFPERAVAALARAVAYAEWRTRPDIPETKFDDFDVDKLRAIIDRRVAAGGGWLDPVDTFDLLDAARIPLARVELARSEEEAIDAAMRLGLPVALKAYGELLLHKSDVGGVILALQDEPSVARAFRELQEKLGETMTGAIVQPMASGGVEVMVGVTEHPTFGHVVAYGAGGTLVELLSDVAFRIHPLTDLDAHDMIAEAKCSKLLAGFRGTPPADRAAVNEILMRVSALLDVCPEIRELDINPLKVFERGAMVVDARINVQAIVPGPPSRRVAY